MKIAFLGTGMMGLPMARRLCLAGHDVRVWNRTIAKAKPLAEHGAKIAASVVDAVWDAKLVFTMLDNGDVVEDVVFAQGGAVALPKGGLVVDMSSIRPEQAISHRQRLEAYGHRHLDAPVSGGTVGAEAGTLAIMVGGDEADLALARPLFKLWGHATHVGPAGAGQWAKLANQMIVGSTVAIVAEALLLAQRGGADIAKVRQAIRGGFAESRVLEVHGQRMVDGDFVKRAAIDVQLKDLRNAIHSAKLSNIPVPLTAGLEALYDLAAQSGLGDLDQAAIFLALQRLNPVTPASSS